MSEAIGALPAARPETVGHDPAMRGAPVARDAAAAAAAQRFEAAFLAEMLRHTGLGRPPEQFGGGPGEARFSGFLVRAYAERLAEAGGVGLARHIEAAILRGQRP